jgi:DNA-binding NarL/FixJ family response regulator
MIRILVADDHPIIRKGVRQIVASAADIQVAGEAGTGPELLERARTLEHDVVLLDISMPEGDGLDLLNQLHRERRHVPVLILTLHAEGQFAARSFKSGAAGYLTKDSAPSELISAIRKVAGGGRYVSPSIAEWLAQRLSLDSETLPHERLSNRELQVLRLIASGRSTRQIATDLSLSVKTIGTYRARIFEKMETRTTAGLALYVARNNLFD